MMRPRAIGFVCLACVVSLAATGGGPRDATPPGADRFGYRMFDAPSAECTFAWAGVEPTGQALSFTASGAEPAEDDGGAVVLLGAPVVLYGVGSSAIVVSTNGYLTLATDLGQEDGGDFSNDRVLPAIPDNAEGRPSRVMVYHDDLDGGVTGGSVYHEFFTVCPRPSEAMGPEACTVVQWDSWGTQPTGDPFDLQAVLYHESHEIALQLRPRANTLVGGTIGIQDARAAVGLQYTPLAVSTDTAVCIFEPHFPPGGPFADLEVSIDDRLEAFAPGQSITYEIGVLNRGPSPTGEVGVSAAAPAGLVDCTWECTAALGSFCTAAGTGPIDDTVLLAAGGWADYVLECTTALGISSIATTITAAGPDLDPDSDDNMATDVDVAGAGRVEPLLLARIGASVELSWDVSCLASDTDYAVYEGDLGEFGSHVPITCSTGGVPQLSHVLPATDKFYLVVPTNTATEGSYGLTSNGVERPASAAACLPRAVAECF